MKKAVLFPMLLGAMCANAFTVVVHSNSGKNLYNSSEIKNITLGETGDVSLIMNDGKTVSMSADEFRWIGFDPNAAINDITADADNFIIQGSFLCSVSNLQIELYDANARLIARSASGRIDVSNIPAGLYIVKSKNSSSKIILK